MAKLIVILGATGKQGGSVVKAFLRDPTFRVRAVARDPESSAAGELRRKGVEVVHGDVTDAGSLSAAFKVSAVSRQFSRRNSQRCREPISSMP